MINKTIKVLYVEDQKDIQEELKDILNMYVDEVITADDGVEGVKMFESHTPDIIITDIQMPNMTGLEMISEIRQLDSKVPIIVTSAFNDNKYLLEAIDLGIEYYLTKPISIEKLHSRIDRIIQLIIQERKALQYNRYLAKKVQEEQELREAKEKLLIAQNKYVEIGHMVGVIAHQWKQPLHYLNLLIEDIGLESEYNAIDKQYIDNFVTKGTAKINFLSQTMGNFLNFYKTNPNASHFSVHKISNELLTFLASSYEAIGLDITISLENDFMIYGIENEFQQVILNLINNAREAYNNKILKDSQILIHIDSVGTTGTIKISDNASGIPADILPNIFDLQFTSKKEGNGIGLYLVKKLITERFHGNIQADNTDNGAEFTLTFNLLRENKEIA